MCVCALVHVCLCVAAAVTSLTGVLHPAVIRLLRLGHPSKPVLPMRDWGLVSDNIADSSVDFWHYAQTTNIQIFLSLFLIFLFFVFPIFISIFSAAKTFKVSCVEFCQGALQVFWSVYGTFEPELSLLLLLLLFVTALSGT